MLRKTHSFQKHDIYTQSQLFIVLVMHKVFTQFYPVTPLAYL